MGDLKATEYKRFEDIKHIRNDGSEYWFARELLLVLDYTQWRNFTKVIDKAMIACNNSGQDVVYDFAEVSKIVDAGATSKPVKDYELSRYACYLIVQNGDPRKEVIALGQTYFAIQTYRQEIADRFNQLDEDSRRLVVRGDIKQWNQLLAEAARDAGVITNEEFAIFQNAGYMGLYGGLTVEDIHKRKGLAIRDKILDFMGSTELI
jgi:DNA-damage-inducible protein D